MVHIEYIEGKKNIVVDPLQLLNSNGNEDITQKSNYTKEIMSEINGT